MNNFADFRRASRRPMAEINLVPFIDVILVLLVIFMITTPLLTQGVQVSLPETQSKAIPPTPLEPLIVTVNAKGELFLNISNQPNQPVTERVLANLVSLQLNQASDEKRPVLVRGDKNVNYGKVMEAMIILQQAGAKNVGLMTQPITSDVLSHV